MADKKRKRKKLHEVDLEKDIKYRGPLSYRAFKIMGWLCLALSQLVMLLSLVNKYMPAGTAPSPTTMMFLSLISSLAVPFLLFSNFSQILSRSDSYKHQILVNGLAALAVVGVYLFIYFHYIVGIGRLFSMEKQDFMALLQSLASGHISGGALSFNIFIDLFLCTMFMFFLNYEPKRFFQDRKQIIFRLFAILPVLYEAASIFIKINAATKQISLSPIAYPFLTTKPPIMFLVFVILVLYIKNRERIFRKYGRTKEEYRTFLNTNRNSLQFSVFAAVLFCIAGIVDLIIFFILYTTFLPSVEMMLDPALSADTINQLSKLGLGNSAGLIPVAPIMLLFSYTRRHKNSLIDHMIPIVGIILIGFVYLEFIFQVILAIPDMFF